MGRCPSCSIWLRQRVPRFFTDSRALGPVRPYSAMGDGEIGDVIEENEVDDDVFVFRRVHVIAELVCGEPEIGLESEVGAGVTGRDFAFGGHDGGVISRLRDVRVLRLLGKQET